MKILHTVTSLIVVAFLSTSCKATRDHVYLQDMNPQQPYAIGTRAEAKVQPDDRISIQVSCKTPELAAPFNLADDAEGGYLVDPEGNIQLPILGDIHVAGLTIKQVQDAVRQKLIDGGYINSPIVSARFLNFHYTVLGAVGQNGQFAVDGERITLLEAIAKAGDLTADAMTDRVAVIREEPDGRKMYLHDLRSTDIFNSPCFYLRQNDVVYVEPKRKSDKNENRAWQFATLGISAASVVCTIIWATK